LEKKLSIPEEVEDDEEGSAGPAETTRATEVSSTDKAEDEVTKGVEIQKTEPKDADKTGVSVGD